MHFENVNFEEEKRLFCSLLLFYHSLCFYLIIMHYFSKSDSFWEQQKFRIHGSWFMVPGLFRCLSIEYLISNDDGISVLDTFQHSYKLPGPIDKLFKSLDFK